MIESILRSLARLILLVRWGEPQEWEDDADPLCSASPSPCGSCWRKTPQIRDRRHGESILG